MKGLSSCLQFCRLALGIDDCLSSLNSEAKGRCCSLSGQLLYQGAIPNLFFSVHTVNMIPCNLFTGVLKYQIIALVLAYILALTSNKSPINPTTIKEGWFNLVFELFNYLQLMHELDYQVCKCYNKWKQDQQPLADALNRGENKCFSSIFINFQWFLSFLITNHLILKIGIWPLSGQVIDDVLGIKVRSKHAKMEIHLLSF